MSFRAASPLPLPGVSPLPGLPSFQPSAASAAEPPSPPAAWAGESAARIHDARNLLAALSLYADLLARPGVLDASHAHYADELRDLARRSAALLCAPLDSPAPSAPATTRPESRPPRDVAAVQDPAAALRSLFPVLCRLAQPSARVDLTLDAGLACTLVDTETLERIALNLVRNAAAALADAPPANGSGRIVVALTRRPDGGCRLEVRDNGPGLPFATAFRLARPNDAPSPVDGHGLGLRIVRDLASRSGASLTVDTRAGEGTAFLLTWEPTPSRNGTPRAAARRRTSRLPGRGRAC